MRRITGEGLTDPGKGITVTEDEGDVVLWTSRAGIITVQEDPPRVSCSGTGVPAHVVITLQEGGLPQLDAATQDPADVSIVVKGKEYVLWDLLAESAALREVILG